MVHVPWQRARIYRAIAELDLHELADHIVGGLASPYAVERAAAARALSELDATEYVEALDAGQPIASADAVAAGDCRGRWCVELLTHGRHGPREYIIWRARHSVS